MTDVDLPDSQAQLVADLQDADAPQVMIEKAEALQYHDYQSDLAFPKMALVRDCRQYRLHDIAKNAMGGRYDP